MTDDADFLGLTTDGDRTTFAVVDHLARLDGKLYGGTAIAVSIAAAERRTGSPVLWVTTQFVATAPADAVIDVRTEVLAAGYRTNQVRVTATTDDGEVVFASLGATGRHRPDGLAGVFERCPTVSPPDDAEPWTTPFTGVTKAAGIDHRDLPFRKVGFSRAIDLREPVVIEHPEAGPGRICLWVRRTDGAPITRAVAAYIADIVPMSVACALGVVAGGTSLDNTIRIGDFVETGWMLLDLRPHLAVGGYAHGIVNLWSEDGHLLGTASQTVAMRVFDAAHIPGLGPSGSEPDRHAPTG